MVVEETFGNAEYYYRNDKTNFFYRDEKLVSYSDTKLALPLNNEGGLKLLTTAGFLMILDSHIRSMINLKAKLKDLNSLSNVNEIVEIIKEGEKNGGTGTETEGEGGKGREIKKEREKEIEGEKEAEKDGLLALAAIIGYSMSTKQELYISRYNLLFYEIHIF